MKKLIKLSLITAFLCLIFFAPALTAEAASSGSCGDNLSWTLNASGVLTISGTGKMTDYSSSYDDNYHPWDSSDVKKIVVNSGVNSIGNNAFRYCEYATSVTIPNTVTRIGEYAFCGCESLASITIPNSVIEIGEYAFGYCSKITSLAIPNSVKSISNRMCYGCSSLTTVTIPNSITNIGTSAFSGCEVLTGVSIPNSVVSIGDYAFYGCSSLKSITIPDSITCINSETFRNCSSLASVTIPDSVTSIYYSTFSGCTSLKGITLPNSVTYIGSYAFSGCTNLTEFVIPDKVSYIHDGLFSGCTSLSTISIPESVKSIEGYAFSGCSALKNITLPDSIEHIYYNAFENCTFLQSIIIPQNVSYISNAVFKGCINLTTVALPENVTYIGEYAFSGCSKLSSINLNKVEEIGKYAFENCSSLSSADLSSVETIAEYAFISCSNLMSVSFSNCLASVSTGGFRYCPNSMIVNYFGSESEWNAVEIKNYNEPLTGKKPQYLKEYSITYVLNGGTNAVGNPSTYFTSQSITLQNPTRSGYVFAGWYSDPNFTTKVTGIPAGSTGDKTFYARWAVSYSITYVLNGGTNSSSNPSSYLTTQSVTLQNPTRNGYSFSGWYSDSGFSTKVTGIPAGSSGNKTFYAKWTLISYSIKYYLNGGQNNSANPSTYTINTTVTLKDPVRSDSTFLGWYTDSSFTNKVTGISTGSTGNKTFYAKWTYVEYPITYVLNGGTNSADNPAVYTSDTAVTLKDPAREGYDFSGWYTDSSFTNKVTGISVGSTGAKTFYAKWALKQYSITYVLIGGTNNSSNPSKYTAEDAITLMNPVKTGYSFAGWYTNSSFTTRTTGISKGSTGNKTFYAKWSLITYTISYVLDGGKNAADNPASYTVDMAVTFKDPTREGYDFLGWYADSSFVTKVAGIPSGSTGNKTFYAKWRKRYLIKYELNGGTNAAGNPAYYNETSAVTLKSPTRAGCDFEGWYSDQNFNTKVTGIAVGSTGDKTFYAKWTLKNYKITYFLNGGINSADNPATYNTEQIIMLADPVKGDMAFLGWYSDAAFTRPVKAIPKGSTGDKTFYARWSKAAGECGSSMSWILNYDGVMTIGGSGNMSNYTPAGVPYIEHKQSISQVVFNNGVTSIGDCAFYNCQKLASVTIPSTMKSIGSKAFYGCSGLKSIRVPSSVTSIGSDAFGLVVSNDLLKNYSCIPVIYFGGTKAAWNQIGYKLRSDQIVFFNVNPSVIPQIPTSFKLSAETYTYTGEEIRPKVTVYDENGKNISDAVCAVTYSGNKNTGTAKVEVSFTNCNVEKTLAFKIVKAVNPMTAKGRTVNIKNSKVSVKNQTVKRTKAFTINNAQGALSFKLAGVTKSAFKKYFKINAKTGKITVKKGLPVGIYKVKVKVKAAGDTNYKASAVKKVTVKVNVK